MGAWPAGVLFQSQAARGLWPDIFHFSGGYFTASQLDCFAGVAMALEGADGAFAQSRGRKNEAAFRPGNGLSAPASTASAAGSSSRPALPRTIPASQRADRTVTANRGTPADGFFAQGLSASRFSTPFSASVFGLAALIFFQITTAGFFRRRFCAGDNTIILFPSAPGSR